MEMTIETAFEDTSPSVFAAADTGNSSGKGGIYQRWATTPGNAYSYE